VEEWRKEKERKSSKVKRLRDAYGNMSHATCRGRRLQDKW